MIGAAFAILGAAIWVGLIFATFKLVTRPRDSESDSDWKYAIDDDGNVVRT